MKRERGTGSVYHQPGSKVCWIKYYVGGAAIRESSKTTDRKKADKLLKTKLAQITAGNYVGVTPQKVRVNELAEDFLREYRINDRKSLDDAKTRWETHL